MTKHTLSSSAVELEDSLDAISDYYYKQGWTDGLPIVPPVAERVQRFINYIQRDPQEVVVRILPSNDAATIEKIAINMVMAGCRPEYFPVVIAQLEAVAEPEYNLESSQVTTNPVAPLTIINGPIRQTLEVNCSTNAAGQGWRANATIGRALRLILVNVGGAIPGKVSKSTIGWPARYTFCIGENEEESPWEPLHVERGLPRETSAVTVAPIAGYHELNMAFAPADSWLFQVAATLALPVAASAWYYQVQPVVLVSPMHAGILAQAGYTKQKVKEDLYKRTFVPLSAFHPEVLEKILPRPDRREIVDGKYPLLESPDALCIVVVGGPGGVHTAVLHPSGQSWTVTKPITLRSSQQGSHESRGGVQG